jgi:uncharacterized protein (TIRG00374 family)
MLWVKLIVTLSLLGYLFYHLDIVMTFQLLSQVNISLFLLSFTLYCFLNVVGAFRWKILLKFNQNYFSIFTLTRFYFIGAFFILFLPATVGNDLARWYYLHDHGVKTNEAMSSIIFERFIGVSVIVFVTCCGVFLIDFEIVAHDIIKLTVLISVLACLVFYVILWNGYDFFLKKWLPQKVQSKLSLIIALIKDLKDYSRSVHISFFVFLISFLSYLLGIFSAYLISLSLGYSMNFLIFCTLFSIVLLVSMIPISINGLGVREGTLVFLFASMGMPKEIALAISILYFLQIVALGMIGGIFFLVEKKDLKKIENYSPI